MSREKSASSPLARLGRVLCERPEVKERTGRYLAGDLEGGPMAENMSNRTLRLPDALLARAEALIPVMEKDPAILPWGGTINQSIVLRAALAAGLDALEERYGEPKAKRKVGKK